MSEIPINNKDRLRIVVMGHVVRGPLGGFAWHHLQYVLGLLALGHDVFFLEDSADYPACYDPSRGVTDEDPTYGLGFMARCFEALRLPQHWAYHDAHREVWHGPSAESVLQVCAHADLLLDLSAMDPIRPWVEEIPKRILIDTDPGFLQVQILQIPEAREWAQRHTSFFSFGGNLGQADCSIPDDCLPWQPTRQPVVLEAWPPIAGREQSKFTTVMQWDSYPELEYGGRRLGMKSHSFGPYMNLPARAGRVFLLALTGTKTPFAELLQNGWILNDSVEISRGMDTYRRFIQQSKAEFSVAKHGYVATWGGWFSERSASYLASGRPVLTQDTGFSDWLPTGAGVLAFTSPDEALAGIEEINRRYKFHCRAARDIAAEYFDSRKVLTLLIERAMN